MLCYRDMTFCPHWIGCVAGADCRRAATQSVERAADDFGLPLALFSDKPKCFVHVDQSNPEEAV